MLRIEGLAAGYGGSRVLDGVDLELEDGEALALLGRNGMGKTTLLRAVMGLLAPQAGRVRLDGRDITGWPPHAVARAGIGYVPQGRLVFARLSVEQNLELGRLGKPPGERRPSAELLADFPLLAERAGQPAGTLSGGEQQQLAIARALAGRPRLLLLDEPSEGLQPSMVEQLAGSLAAIGAREGLALLVVEQNIDMVLELALRAAFIENGRIVASHPIEELRAEPALLERHLAV